MRGMRATVGAALLAGALLAPSAAWVASATEVIEGEHLRLVSTLDREAAADLAPGESVEWWVEVGATTEEPGEITVSLRGLGDLAVEVSVHRCGVAWEGDSCAQGEEQLRPLSSVSGEGAREELARFDAADTLRLRLRVVAPADPPQGARTDVRVVADGFGEEAEAGGPSEDLPATGGTVLWPIAFGALAAVAIGAGLVSRRGAARVSRGDER